MEDGSIGQFMKSGQNLMSSFLLVIEIHAIKVLPRIYLDLEKYGWKWRFYAWHRVKMEELWRPNGIRRLTFTSSIEWWKPHLFIPSSHYNPWLGPVWCIHAQTMRKMAENGVLFDGMELNGGVRASKLNSFLVFILYRMVKTTSLHSF